ncbi:hypothetical protein E1B28_003648 [Marasmius oreades]|uniref:Uncharacterized protein n=1 Tax=Marasmius oreades TaxID=181124 RepID=A0A9P7UX34_9AGAR|nr:uncharacterized protein E1B28_003648 [Marasmius oreades]KAG7096198.1 hypothetical protein E1B28_003648 [Marasmius oreades]
MTLTTGTFFIFSPRGELIARHENEDKSLDPKPVVKHVKPIRPDYALWDATHLIGGKPNVYQLSNRKADTGPSDKLVWAFLKDDDPHRETWIIEPARGDHPNGYRIFTFDKKSRWVIPEGDKDGQIQCQPLGTDQQDVFLFFHVKD